jgi:hypothetical protein
LGFWNLSDFEFPRSYEYGSFHISIMVRASDLQVNSISQHTCIIDPGWYDGSPDGLTMNVQRPDTRR